MYVVLIIVDLNHLICKGKNRLCIRNNDNNHLNVDIIIST